MIKNNVNIEEAKKYTANLYKLYQHLSDDMKKHLAEIKGGSPQKPIQKDLNKSPLEYVFYG